MAEKYPNISPYAYCAQNPITYVDPDGMRIRNGDRIRMEKKQKEINEWKAKIADYETKFGITAESKGNNENAYRKYENLKNGLKKNEEELATLTGYAKLTDERIAEFAKQNEVMYNIMDTMVNDYNEDVDIMVGITPSSPGRWGTTEPNFDYTDGKTRPMSNDFGINTVSILLAEKMRADAFSPIDTPSTVQTTRHEMGHANYIIQNAYSYMMYIADRLKRGVNLNGGHNSGNPSGERATQWQNGNPQVNP